MSNTFFERSVPEHYGIRSGDISDFIDALCGHPSGQETHSFMIIRHGTVISEGYFYPYTADKAHTVYSITKAFTGMAIGLLEAEGKLSLSDKAASYFPEYEIHPTLSDLTIDHMMMMGTGQTGSAAVHDTSGSLNTDVAEFFMTPSDIPHGSEFRYQNRVSYVLARLAEKLSGENLLNYLNRRVFSPMGIDTPYAVSDPEGYCLGYSGMRFRPEELAAIGQMLMNHGIWQGKQILPAGWADRQIARHIGRDEPDLGDWSQGYCYQLWRGRYNTSRLCGAYGQMCVMIPDKDMLFVTNSGYDSDIQFILNCFYKHVLLKTNDAPLPEDRSAAEALKCKTSDLVLHQLYSSPSPALYSFIGKNINISGTESSVILENKHDSLSVRINRPGKKDIVFTAGFDKMTRSPADGGDIIPYEFGDKGEWFAAAYWDSQSRLVITSRLVPTQVKLDLQVFMTENGISAECVIRRGSPL